MATLPPLRVPKKSQGVSSKPGAPSMGESPEGIPGKDQLNSLRKDTAKLLEVTFIYSYRGSTVGRYW